MKKIPMRTCVITHEKLEKKDLLRVVKDNMGKVFIDDTYKANGRGCYLKKDIDVISKAQKNKALDNHLKISVDDKIYEELKTKI